jgi:hypothetical protein
LLEVKEVKTAEVTVTGVPGFDGTYEWDDTPFNGHELHVIKTFAGVRIGELRRRSALVTMT